MVGKCRDSHGKRLLDLLYHLRQGFHQLKGYTPKQGPRLGMGGLQQ